jgi:hypothetical protein
MTTHPQNNLALILVVLMGLHVIHFVVTYYIRMGQMRLRRSTDPSRPINIQNQEIILRGFCHFVLIMTLLWMLCGYMAVVLAAIATTAHLIIDYWCQRSAASETRIYWAKAGIGNLFYSLLYGGLATSAYAIKTSHFFN